MLPLKPPAQPNDPGYPQRSQALADDDSRRRLHGILAASVLGLALGGCGGQAAPQQLMGRTAPPQQQPAQPQPLPGAVPAQPQLLSGKPAVPQAAEPEAPLRGEVMAPVSPQVVPVPKADGAKQEVQQEAVPLPMMGVMVAPQAPPRDPT